MRAQLYASKKQYTEAVQELKQAYKLLQNNPRSPSRDLAKTQLALAEIYVQQNQLETAKLALKRVYTRLLQNSVPSFDPQQEVPEVHQLYPENTLMDALDLHAHIATLENDSRLGVQLYEHAAYVGMLLNTAQRNQQSRLIMQSNIKRRVAAYLALTHALYLEEKDPTILEKAFLMSQKATASIVSETYLSKKQRQPYRDDALCIDLEQREKKQANWKVEVYENQKLGIPNPLEYAAILDSIDQNGFQIKTIQNRLRQKYPALNETHEIVLSEVQSKARKKGQTVVSYFMGTTASYQFVISGNEVTFNRLSSDAKSQELFKQECIQFISYFRDAGRINNDPSGYTKAAFLLFKKLNLPDADALIIIPDSFLQFIPFDALLTKESKGFQYENMPFLLHESRVSYALSPLLYLEEDIPMVTRPLALGVFPVFEGTPLELTHSVEEARALEDSFDGTLLMHEEASSASAFAKAGTHQILHFSTHASGGTLRTPAYLQLYDARIPVNQLYGDQWQTDLVVLSACETGIGAIISGEGAQSLARGFQYAGVQNIAFTLWQVNDRSTATLMSTYYQNLNKTRSRNESLQAAKKNYLADSSIPNTKKSPYYWAAFVYYGTTDVSQSYNSWMWWCGLGILVLFLVFLLKRKHGITA
ncbi:MAG: CHAT domain-containing protein [Dokdonia sp.]|nr:CHAT domain-containing protein [Dokdonia sp.]